MSDKVTATPTTETPENTTASVTPMLPDDPNAHFQQWLTMNNYKVSIDALSDNNPYLEGKGVVLTDKPLLVVCIKKKGDN